MTFEKNRLLTFDLGNEYHRSINYEVNKEIIDDLIERSKFDIPPILLSVDNTNIIEIAITKVAGRICNLFLDIDYNHNKLALFGDIKIIDTPMGASVKNMLESFMRVRFCPLLSSTYHLNKENDLVIKKFRGFNIDIVLRDERIPYIGQSNDLKILEDLDEKINNYLQENNLV